MRPLVVLTAAGFGGFAALLSVAPLWVARGGAGEAGAGLVTGVLLLLTILTQPFVPWLLNRFGHGLVLAAGLVAMGAPAPFYGLSDALAPVLALSAVRGVGFGILTVTGSAVVAELVSQERRGEAVGVYGLGVAVPHLLFLPGSVALAEAAGFGWVFVLGACPLLGIPAALRLGVVLRRRGQEEDPERREVRRTPISAAVLGRVAMPALVLFAVTVSGGGVMTFLPQTIASPQLASWGLFVIGGVAAFSRWWIGRVGDRRGAGRLMAPLLLLTTVGLGLTALSVSDPERLWLLLPAMAVVGFGYGALQNLTLVCAFAQVTARHYGSASAVWNVGFDAGTGLGAVMLGVIAGAAGFPVGFAASAVVVVLCVPFSLRVDARPA